MDGPALLPDQRSDAGGDDAVAFGLDQQSAPRDARRLLDDIALLLDHLGRHRPGRLDACFEDSRGDLQRPAGVPAPPRARPNDATPTKAAFLARWADIGARADAAAVGRGSEGLDRAWDGFVDDLVFLVTARDFLAALACPATVDTIRLTRAYVRQMAQPAPFFQLRSPPVALGTRADEVLGRRLGTTVRFLRVLCFWLVLLTLAVSLMAFGGKRLLEEQDRTLSFLGTVTSEIAAEQRAAPAGGASAGGAVQGGAQGGAPGGADFGFAYCDAPFIDATGAVRYLSPRQETLCNRLWGINRAANMLNGQLESWGSTWLAQAAMLAAGLSANGAEGRVREFAEAARPADLADALLLLGLTPAAVVRGEAAGELLAKARQAADDATVTYQTRGYRGERNRAARGTSPTQAKAMIEALSLYVMPCLYALLGAFVAVFQALKRRAAAHLLDRSERDQAIQTVLFGLVFGAVVGILADMLRVKPVSGAASDEVVLGVSVIALVAGYSVAHVFRFLDGFADRLFGAAPATPAREG